MSSLILLQLPKNPNKLQCYRSGLLLSWGVVTIMGLPAITKVVTTVTQVVSTVTKVATTVTNGVPTIRALMQKGPDREPPYNALTRLKTFIILGVRMENPPSY